MLRQQPCFLCDGIQLDKILPEEKVEPFTILRFLPWEYSQQIAVVKIQCPEAGHLFAGLPVSGHTVMLRFWRGFRQGPCGSSLFQNPPTDAFQRVCLAEVSGKADKAFLPRWADGNILARLDLVTFAVEVLKKLALGHGLANNLINVRTDNPSPSGALLLLCPPFSVVLALSGLGILNNGQTIFPAQGIRNCLQIVVVLCGAVVLDTIHKGHRIQHKMIVKMVRLIQMGGNNHLIPVTP